MTINELIQYLKKAGRLVGGDAEVFVAGRNASAGAWVVGSIETEEEIGDSGTSSVTIVPWRDG